MPLSGIDSESLELVASLQA